MPNENLFLHKTFLWKILEARPDLSKLGYRQSFIWRTLFPWKDLGSRNVMIQRAKSQNQLAGLYGPQGQALPSPDISGEQWLVTMMDVKAAEQVKPDVVRDSFKLGELAVRGALATATGAELKAKVSSEITRMMTKAEDRVDNMLEYLSIGALLNNIVWPPVDNAGSAITPAPPYWNASMAGTWSVGLPANLRQNITGLVDHAGSAASTDQKKVWSDASADIIGAIDVLDQICRQNYAFTIKGGTILARSTLLTHLIKNTAILNKWLGGSGFTNPNAANLITNWTLRDKFIDVLGLNFREYDTFWTYEAPAKGVDYAPVSVNYLPENTIIIIPPKGGDLGAINDWYMGTAPLEDEAGNWQPGYMPWMYKNPKPNYERELGVNVTAWPIFERTEWIKLQVLA